MMPGWQCEFDGQNEYTTPARTLSGDEEGPMAEIQS
jgi:hypothetical protein